MPNGPATMWAILQAGMAARYLTPSGGRVSVGPNSHQVPPTKHPPRSDPGGGRRAY
ncbi:hypothetical protein AZA_15115 [Nitrospirillum viridazoti Y2]|nr:hypothetical protein AZA_15115 [Nitrospirillum amazonense Y2]